MVSCSKHFYRVVLLGIALLSLPLLATSAQVADREADAAFEREDWAEAQRLYIRVLEIGTTQEGRALGNLASAQYRLGQYGLAMRNYLRAQERIPRNSQLNAQIAALRAERPDGFIDEVSILRQTANYTHDLATIFELGVISLSFWTMTFVMLGIASRGRPGLQPFVMILFALFLVFGALFATRLFVRTQTPPAVVINAVATVHSGPGQQYPTLYRVQSATELYVTEQQDQWVRFELPNGRTGWLLRSEIGFIHELDASQ